MGKKELEIIGCGKSRTLTLMIISSPYESRKETKHFRLVSKIFAFRTEKNFKSAVSGLRQFLAIKNPLKMMKNAFYFTSKTLFIVKVLNFLSWFFGHVAKQLDWNDKVNIKFYDFTAWLTNNCNTYVAQYLKT